jgi:DNA-binding transcriptional regulator GbsR (MarR family)
MVRKKSSQEIDELGNLIGEFIQYWGFKKIHGRIWFTIFTSPRPLDAQDLMVRLRISKALASISLKDLLIHEVLIESNTSAAGTRTYVANPDIRGVIQKVLKQRERVMLQKIKNAFQDIKQLDEKQIQDLEIHEESLKEMDRLIFRGEKMLKALMTLI